MKNVSSVFTLLLIVLFAQTVLAGSLDQAAAPSSGSGMPTLEGIYNQLDVGDPAPIAGAFQEPASGPSAGTGRTLLEILGKLPVVDDVNGAASAEVLSGKTFWGLRSDGTWGPQSGSLASAPDVSGGNGALTFPIPDGLYAAKTATASDGNLAAGNIKSGVSIFGVTGTVLQSTGSAAAGDVLTGKTFSNTGSAGVSGTMANQGAASFTPGASAVPVPAGYYSGGQVNTDANLTTGNIRSGVSIFGVAGTSSVVETSAGTAAASDILPGQKAFVNGSLVTGTFTPALSKRVNKTGQVVSYAAGDDGAYQYGVDPVLAPSSGTGTCYNAPAYTGTRFIDNRDGTVTDTLTGLIWLKNAGCLNLAWNGAVATVNALAGDNTQCSLNDGSSAGQWRVPNINELHSLVSLTGSPFTGIQANRYWSSTTNASDATFAWYVDMGTGAVNSSGKPNPSRVWPVRGGQ